MIFLPQNIKCTGSRRCVNFLWANRRNVLLINFIFLSFFAVTNNTAAPSFNFYLSSINVSHRRPASADVSLLKTIK